jgi:hypothetical protein
MRAKVKMVTIKGGKEQGDQQITVDKEQAVLILNGKVIHLDSFILCGTAMEDGEPNRVVLTWNSSMDEMIVYENTLRIAIDDKHRDTLRG